MTPGIPKSVTPRKKQSRKKKKIGQLAGCQARGLAGCPMCMAGWSLRACLADCLSGRLAICQPDALATW